MQSPPKIKEEVVGSSHILNKIIYVVIIVGIDG